MTVLSKYAGKYKRELTSEEQEELKHSARQFKEFCLKIENEQDDFYCKVRADYLDMAVDKKVRRYYWGKFYLKTQHTNLNMDQLAVLSLDLVCYDLNKIKEQEAFEAWKKIYPIQQSELRLMIQVDEKKLLKHNGLLSDWNRKIIDYYRKKLVDHDDYHLSVHEKGAPHFPYKEGQSLNCNEIVCLRKVIEVDEKGEVDLVEIINTMQVMLPLYRELYSNETMIAQDNNHNHSWNRLFCGENLIFYGAPGTGKSYGLQQYINNSLNFSDINLRTSENVYRTTFYPGYSYSDFVGQIMPQLNEDTQQIVYEFVPGIFTEALLFAAKYPKQPVFLIIEEMSRADCAAVFGDIFQLLDRYHGESEYPINHRLIEHYFNQQGVYDYLEKYQKRIYLPANFFIIGTMNTSDQNVYIMDTAFKRRFCLKYVPAKVDCCKNQFDVCLGRKDGQMIMVQWNAIVEVLNRLIVDKNNGLGLNEDKQIGQFFITPNAGNVQEQLTDKLLQYLWNDVEKVVYGKTISLFFDGCSSFGQLYERAKNNQCYFSDKVLTEIIAEDKRMIKNEYNREKRDLETRKDKIAEDYYESGNE